MNRDAQIRKAIAMLLSAVPPENEAHGETLPCFGNLIKTARKNAGLSLQAVADAIHSSKAHVWEVEQSHTNPSTKFVWAVARVLAIDPAFALECAACSYTRKGAFQPSKEPQP